MLPFDQVNIFAVLAATLAAFAIGFAWHGPLFGAKWMQLVNIKQSDMKDPAKAMLKGLASTFVSMYALALVLTIISPSTMVEGVVLAGLLWVFPAKALLERTIWENMSKDLWLINAGFSLVAMVVGAGIIMAWPW